MRLHAQFGNGAICSKRDWGTDHGSLCSQPAEDVPALPINQHTSRENYTYDAKLSMDIDWYGERGRRTFFCETATRPIVRPQKPRKEHLKGMPTIHADTGKRLDHFAAAALTGLLMKPNAKLDFELIADLAWDAAIALERYREGRIAQYRDNG